MMKLSLSGRLVETGSGPLLALPEFLALASRNGYDAVDLRATQLALDTPDGELTALRQGLEEHGLTVFEGAFRGPVDETNEMTFSEFAARIAALGGTGIRVGGDIATLKRAAQAAAAHGVNVLYQMHTGGPFETIAGAAEAIAEIDQPNFGVMPEPANLLMAGETFSTDMFEPLRGRVLGVHVQTLVVTPDASNRLTLNSGAEVRYTRVPYAENTQIDFETFFSALRQIGFNGFVNELEPCPGLDALATVVAEAASFLRPLLSGTR